MEMTAARPRQIDRRFTTKSHHRDEGFLRQKHASPPALGRRSPKSGNRGDVLVHQDLRGGHAARSAGATTPTERKKTAKGRSAGARSHERTLDLSVDFGMFVTPPRTTTFSS